jgi:predicted RNA-binding Zn ribbon-like protein
VVFAHDTELALQSAVALVNSAVEPDTLTTVDELDEWYAEYSYTGSRRRGRAELESVRELRPVLRRLLTSDRDDAARQVNAMLAEAGALPQLVRHEPFDWHLHALPSGAALATRVAVETAMAMVDVIRSDEMSRLGVCADESCEGLVLDLSRNRSRRYCSVACGNRNSVAAFRARQAEQ